MYCNKCFYSETSFSILGTELQQMKEELRTKLKKIKLSFWHLNTISSFPKIILLYIFLSAKQRSCNRKLRDTCCLRRSFTSTSIWFICNMWVNNCLLKSPVETCMTIKQLIENTVGSEILAIRAVIQSFQTLSVSCSWIWVKFSFNHKILRHSNLQETILYWKDIPTQAWFKNKARGASHCGLGAKRLQLPEAMIAECWQQFPLINSFITMATQFRRLGSL